MNCSPYLEMQMTLFVFLFLFLFLFLFFIARSCPAVANAEVPQKYLLECCKTSLSLSSSTSLPLCSDRAVPYRAVQAYC
jgi:hypothetical protein